MYKGRILIPDTIGLLWPILPDMILNHVVVYTQDSRYSSNSESSIQNMTEWNLLDPSREVLVESGFD